MLEGIINIARRNSVARRVYRLFKGINYSFINAIPQITAISVRKSRFNFERINIIIPSVNQKHMFGGAATALKIFDEIIKGISSEAKVRIILTDAGPDREAIDHFNGYRVVSADDDIDERFQILPFIENIPRKIFITENDRFIVTAWWTACVAQEIIRQQAEIYSQGYNKMIYVIQDFEPNFYNWSTNFVVADSTYKADIPIIAIFNSSMLMEFFKERGYTFNEEFFFEPRLNESLKRRIGNKTGLRKNNILFYGRPSVDRNCFPLIIEALRKWVRIQRDISDWQLISIGEQHPAVNLGNGAVLKSLGKLSLSDYADLLCESAIGLSFMVSPHPSYPPLEMAHFGLLTITNSYANKDLSKSHDNIVSLDFLTPDTVASELVKMTERFSMNPNAGSEGKSHIPYYCQNSPQFPFLDELIDVFIS